MVMISSIEHLLVMQEVLDFFIKNNLKYSNINIFNLELQNCEDIWIELTLATNKKLIVGSIYRHPSYNIKDFQTKFAKTIEHLNRLNKNFIIGGDFNIDLLDNSSVTQNFKNEIYSQGSWQSVKNATRIPEKNKKSLLDHVYSNMSSREILTETILYDISDHLPNITFINTHISIKPPNHKSFVRNLKHFKTEKFLSDLKTRLSCIPKLSANSKWNYFEKTFQSILDKHAPMRLQTRKEVKRKFKPWITRGIINSLKTKYKLHKAYLTDDTDEKSNNFKIL